MGRARRETAVGTGPAPRALSPGSVPEGPGAAARAAARAGLYVHVPFCAARCAYCDFSSGRFSSAGVERWLAGVEREAVRRGPAASGLVFSSVFLGGGTPSTLTPRHVHRLFGALRRSFAIAPDAEITLEANPESVEARRLAAWRAVGANRLSIGAQSFLGPELAALGRVHAPAGPGRAIALARSHGFGRLSLDLMFGFPGHTLENWRTTLECALELAPEHLSAYAFIPEPGTPLGEAVLSGRALVLPDEEQAEAYALFLERAARAGLGSYETSNVCRPGAEARHNLVYWLRRPCAALGPSAHGLLRGGRYGNHRDFARWAEALERGAWPEAEREPESAAARAREILMLGLRLTTGVRAADYAPALWSETTRRYGKALAQALATGRLIATRDGFALPRTLRYLADDVLAWIEARAEAHGVDSRSAHSVPWDSCRIPPSSATGAAPIRP
jgi:putative oxygen-independent coproporphyrinogen III oxidase